ncbi:MAG: diphthamide biosynthesis enzyme Dph2 [Candidatus Woesearchaeota archaeon]|nr:diphthamide biosynthesis enzyme Dph2 [Candidatus Woesearchaeota archaeon]
MRFNFQLDKTIQELVERKPKTVLVQLPLGIKMDVLDIMAPLQTAVPATRFIISGEHCWGGCDIDLDEAKAVGAELIVHFGHAPFVKIDFPILYVYVEDTKDLMPLAEKSKKFLEQYTTIGLVSSIQHIHLIEKIKQFYEQHGKKVFIPNKQGYAHVNGHVVGCEYGGLKKSKKENNIEAVVVLGNQFHALGAALALPETPVILLDTYNEDVVLMDEKRREIITQRAASIEKMKEAKTVGIIIGLKVGQKFGAYQLLKEGFEKQGKNVLLITMREMTPDKIYNFYTVDGFVELACPRIAVDDFERYKKPIITFKEALVVLGKNKWEELFTDGFV